ncbi:MAG: EF-P lysine aminoacylase GenX [Gammaproteobacteria bacterium]|nr:EF-P lysine aminoacylase GenX [Gammaproteobacteria bacterium]
MPTDAQQQWRPVATLDHLRRRARLLAEARDYFAATGALEVDTPLLSRAGNPDPNIESFRVLRAGADEPWWLGTSPEFHMKRLLAAGSGAIYQITHAFRDAERGRLHNPEFTLLEWYRPGLDHHGLMDDVDALVTRLTGWPAARRSSYAQVFRQRAGFDPHTIDDAGLRRVVRERIGPGFGSEPRAVLLDLAMGHLVAPGLGAGTPVFVYDFPAEQAALARIRPGTPALAERFELFVEGVELANGFHELRAADEQRARFERDCAQRDEAGCPGPPIDEHLLAALAAGLPACAGVALGFDRLVMLAGGVSRLEEILAFPCDRA